jgi:GDP-D-mannose dehydratase|tara:strand:+ start:117 stop:1022 length:906 start_codon:yes stop_codon:yes gene_type:complete
LAEHILNKDKKIKIYGLYRSNKYKKILENQFKRRITFYKVDLNNFLKTQKIINKIKPDLVFNLASNADVRKSFDYPYEFIQNNHNSTLNLLESIRKCNLKSLFIHCSTSEVYGTVSKKEIPIKEDQKMKPVSPYAVSKAFQDLLSQLYHEVYGLNIIITRMFTYNNPRRLNLFQSAFASQIVEIEKGKKKILSHGNLNSIRSFLDLNDGMEAYWATAKKGKVGEIYNIGGNKSFKVGDFLKKLIHFSKVKIKCKINRSLLRSKDVTLQIPSVKKFKKHTKWKPVVNFDKSLLNILDEFRKK